MDDFYAWLNNHATASRHLHKLLKIPKPYFRSIYQFQFRRIFSNNEPIVKRQRRCCFQGIGYCTPTPYSLKLTIIRCATYFNRSVCKNLININRVHEFIAFTAKKR
jgi:hypothetical protein